MSEVYTIGIEIETQFEGREFDCEDVCSLAGLEYQSDWVEHLANDDPDRLADILGIDLSEHQEFESELSLPEGWEQKSDCSVTGPEFVSPILFSNDMETIGSDLESVYDRIDSHGLTCDRQCSAHIHIGVDVVSEKHHVFHRELFRALSRRFNQLPMSVQNRIGYPNQYFAANYDDFGAKYSPVRLHPTYKTWEFRLFGNCQDSQEVLACISVAIDSVNEALQNIKDLPGNHHYNDIGWVNRADLAMRTLSEITGYELDAPF